MSTVLLLVASNVSSEIGLVLQEYWAEGSSVAACEASSRSDETWVPRAFSKEIHRVQALEELRVFMERGLVRNSFHRGSWYKPRVTSEGILHSRGLSSQQNH